MPHTLEVQNTTLKLENQTELINSTMALLWTAFSIVVLLYILQQLLSTDKKKKLPPGPIGLPILGHLHLIGNNPHQDLHHLARKHGPIMHMRLGSVPAIVVSSPAGAELFLKTHDLVFASRPPLEATNYICNYKSMTFAVYGPYWRNMRKLCTMKLLSNLKITQFLPMIKAELGHLIDSFKQAAEMHDVLDVSGRVSALQGDLICLMVYGKKYAEKDLDQTGFKAVMKETMEVSAAFNLADYFPYVGVLDLQGLTRRLKRLTKIFDGFLEKIIDDHVQNKKEKNQTQDIVDTMMGIMESGEAEFEFDRRHVKAVLLDIFIAGLDTSPPVVEWALSELIRHPKAMKKLKEELETVVGLEQMVDETHLDSLKYLDMVIKETLRLHPVAPLLLPHESTEDCTVASFHIPKKSRIIINTWSIGRDPKVWPNPEMFSPERFIGSNVDLRGQDFELLAFGSGRRACPGMNLALMIVRLTLAQLVHCFDWELPNGMLPSDLDMSEHFGLAMSRAKHLVAIPTYRLNK